jgi:hypothetical protein
MLQGNAISSTSSCLGTSLASLCARPPMRSSGGTTTSWPHPTSMVRRLARARRQVLDAWPRPVEA